MMVGITVRRIWIWLRWALAALFTFVALSMLVATPIATVVIALGAALICPPIGERIGSLLGGRGWVPIVGGLLIAVFGGIASLLAFAPTEAEQKLRAEDKAQKFAAEQSLELARQQEEGRQREEKRLIAEEKSRQQENARREREVQVIAERRRKECSDTLGAFVMSQNFVKRSLRAPSTADFPYMTSQGVSSTVSGDCKFRVIAYVDAQNAFGAMLRTVYSIDMKYEPSTKMWSGSNLQM